MNECVEFSFELLSTFTPQIVQFCDDGKYIHLPVVAVTNVLLQVYKKKKK